MKAYKLRPVKRTKTASECAAEWNRQLKSNEYTQRRMTFGQYVNVQIKDIPDDYIKWGIINLSTNIAELFARELQRRHPKYRK